MMTLKMRFCEICNNQEAKLLVTFEQDKSTFELCLSCCMDLTSVNELIPVGDLTIRPLGPQQGIQLTLV